MHVYILYVYLNRILFFITIFLNLMLIWEQLLNWLYKMYYTIVVLHLQERKPIAEH